MYIQYTLFCTAHFNLLAVHTRNIVGHNSFSNSALFVVDSELVLKLKSSAAKKRRGPWEDKVWPCQARGVVIEVIPLRILRSLEALPVGSGKKPPA